MLNKPVFYSAVGELHERKPGISRPPGWVNASPFRRIYFAGTPKEAYHTGLDLNKNVPIFDSDAHSPVWSCSGTVDRPGIVRFAGFLSPGWGNVVIIEYPYDGPDKIWGRFAHVEDVRVHVGQEVYWNTQIAKVGRINVNEPYHCHFDLIKNPKILERPEHWPKKNLTEFDLYYMDPDKVIAEHGQEGIPMPDPVPGRKLYVQSEDGLRLRTVPDGTILRTLPQNTEVEGFETEVKGTITWVRVVTPVGPGWMGLKQGTVTYLADTPVGPPPIPVGDTPYKDQINLWVWHPVGANIDTLADSIPNTVSGLVVKTSDGIKWQGENDHHPTLGITGVDKVDEWVLTLANYGLKFHAWAVINGDGNQEALDKEAQLIIDVCNRPGVKSMVLDIEPHTGFWRGPREVIKPLMRKIVAAIPPGFHIGMSVDPRSQHWARIFPDEWREFIGSIHPQVYWETFQVQPQDALREAYNVWGVYGKPIIPVLQGDSTVAKIKDGRNTAKNVYRAQGVSWWRYDVMGFDQMAAISDTVPTPDITETMETTDNLRARSKPTIVNSVTNRIIPKGEILRVTGKYSGAGATSWGRFPDEPKESYGSRDFLRPAAAPVVRTRMFVWAKPWMNKRALPDLNSPDVGDIPYGTELLVERIGVLEDGWLWGALEDGTFVAIESAAGDVKLLSILAPPVVQIPELDKWTFGVHKHEGPMQGTDGNVTNQWLLRMADEGLINSIYVINDFGFANAMAARGVLVFFRRQLGAGDNIGEHITGTPSDVEIGKRLMRNNINMDAHFNLHPAVVLIPYGTCEANMGKDGSLFLGYCMVGTELGRRIGCFTNSFGTPANLNMVNGRFVANEVWQERIDSGCLAYMKRHGHVAIYNAYSRARNLINPANGQVVGFKETHDYACQRWPDGTSDNLAYRWYSGQWTFVWVEVLPEDCRPDIAYGECGSSAAMIATLGGTKSPDGNIDLPGPGGLFALTWDLMGMVGRLARDPHVIAYNYWGVGGDGGGDRPKGLYGFAYSSWDNLLSGVYTVVKVERPKYARSVRRAA